ncbi:MAG: hypothetical protein EA341_18205 [Mongoliibacter sp.]|uniref:YdeI/OmpD-associated family protein n=1 Tax=Mongoliibacter sp. TaxID=2022438 RepID=UPI0012F32C5A|nr:YdeI/OmpD-associated family protein [Mongoliibacter sp.]TVP43451.1 MAG: hypothetical protein EA341_18205 [Mongoliibacter sp.]
MIVEKPWSQEITFLNEIMKKTEMKHCIKWGIDVYTFNGQNIVGICGFKNYVGLWFYNGVFLTDEEEVFINAQENKTKALRQWRFNGLKEIKEDLVLRYVKEAIQNEKEGKRWVTEKSDKIEINGLLGEAIGADLRLKEAFESLSNYKQKEYLDHINSAKREATQQSRLEKIKPMILERKGLNDKYLKK